MKGQIVAAFAICFFAIASCRTIQWPRDTTREELFPIRSTGPYYPPPPKDWTRVRREANPQGGLTVEVQKPLSGPDRRPSVNLDYNHNLLNNGRTNVNAYGGGTWQQGSPVQPHAGMNFQHNFGRNGNGFVGGFGQVQPGPRGGFSPSFGVGGGFRFRRDLQLEDEETFDNLEEETFDNLE